LPLAQNTALFSLLGTTYGGDGRTTFGLPNLMGSAPLQQGQGPGLSYRSLGEQAGEQSVTLLASQMPSHSHTVAAVAGLGDTNDPTGALLAEAGEGRVLDRLYGSGTSPNASLSPQAYAVAGGSLPHNNLPPYLVVTFIIALTGIFPPRS
jgi:microcystin-dependent protein